MSATKSERLHQIAARGGQVTTLAGANDLFYLSRQVSPGNWDNNVINATDLASQILSQIVQTSIASELTFKDGLAVEFFEDYNAGPITVFNKGFGWNGNGVGSGSTIVTRTGHGNTSPQQKRLELISGQYGRKFAWGDSWSRMQIAVLWRINSAVATFGPSVFKFGVCSGTANMVASASCDNFVGMKGANNGATDGTLGVGTRVSYYDLNPNVRFVSRRGVTDTDRTSGVGNNGRHVSATEGFLSVFLIEISRPTFATDASSVTYSFGRQLTNLTQVEMSLAKNTLIEILEGQDFGSTLASGSAMAQITSGGLGGVTTTYSFDQSTGKLDTFNFYWDQAFGCELAALGARKIF